MKICEGSGKPAKKKVTVRDLPNGTTFKIANTGVLRTRTDQGYIVHGVSSSDLTHVTLSAAMSVADHEVTMIYPDACITLGPGRTP